jgi:hypothetical protein
VSTKQTTPLEVLWTWWGRKKSLAVTGIELQPFNLRHFANMCWLILFLCSSRENNLCYLKLMQRSEDKRPLSSIIRKVGDENSNLIEAGY